MLEKLLPHKEILTDIGIRAGIFLGILLITFLVTRIFKKIIARKESFVLIDKTQYKFLSHFISGLIYFIGGFAALYSIPALQGFSTTMFAGSGVLAIIIGFASQHAFANIVSGVFIALFKPFRLGDRVRFIEKQAVGFIEDITLRHTVIRTYDNKRVIVPNSVISVQILENANIVDQKTQKFFEIGISYDSDVDLAKKIIFEEAVKHPLFLDARSEEDIAENVEPVKVRLIAFGESSLILRAYIWCKSPADAFVLGCDLNESVKKRFDAAGIEIPFPYRTLVIKDKKARVLGEAVTPPTTGVEGGEGI